MTELFRRLASRQAIATPPVDYYPMSPSCQIPHLAFLYQLVFGERTSGLFVEVGAFDGYTCSNTSGLADIGWRGIYVEPVPASADLCRARYEHRESIEVVNVAIGAERGELIINVGGLYSTPLGEVVEECRHLPWARDAFDQLDVVRVEMQTLDQLLADRHIEPGFDLLVVDVEGYEPEVFAGFDLARWHPRMLIVELTDAHPFVTSNRQRHAELARRIRLEGYDVLFKDTTNTVFVAPPRS